MGVNKRPISWRTVCYALRAQNSIRSLLETTPLSPLAPVTAMARLAAGEECVGFAHGGVSDIAGNGESCQSPTTLLLQSFARRQPL